MLHAQRIPNQNFTDSPSDIFFNLFDIKIPSQVELKQAFKLRHKVFCQQLGYFSKRSTQLDSGLESDEFDHNAIHCIVTYKATGEVVGCVRLVSPNLQHKLPFSSYIPDYPVQAKSHEISRLVVCPHFRHNMQGLNINALIFRALFMSINVICEHIGVNSAYIFIERKMARALKLFGFQMVETTEKVTIELDNQTVSQRCLYRVGLFSAEQSARMSTKIFMEEVQSAIYPAFHHFFHPHLMQTQSEPKLAFA